MIQLMLRSHRPLIKPRARRSCQEVCKKRSGGSLPGSYRDLHSVDVLCAVVDLLQQLWGVQSPEPLLGDQQHLPDDRGRVLHSLEPFRCIRPQPEGGEGRLVQADDSGDPHRPITLAYDGLDRLLAETTALGTVAYAYDTLGRRTQMQVNDLNPVTYTYDVASRLRTITQAPQHPVSIDYDALGRRPRP